MNHVQGLQISEIKHRARECFVATQGRTVFSWHARSRMTIVQLSMIASGEPAVQRHKQNCDVPTVQIDFNQANQKTRPCKPFETRQQRRPRLIHAHLLRNHQAKAHTQQVAYYQQQRQSIA